MVVVARVIWTTDVAVLNPRVTALPMHRNGFDLVPYYLTTLRVTRFGCRRSLPTGGHGGRGDDRLRGRETSFSGLLGPGLVPVLIPIGLLAGPSAVVTLLLFVAMAGNKIQGLAVVRGLGMLIAGLPCLPWFIHSGWSLAFGVQRRSGSPTTGAAGGRT